MRRLIFLVFMVGISFIYLISCDGGDGNGEEESGVYDVLIDFQELNNVQASADCPESADMKLSLWIRGNKIMGQAQLFDFGNIGEPVYINGNIENNVFTLDTFEVIVYGRSAEFGDSITRQSLQLEFEQFQGMFDDISEIDSPGRVEGNVSGGILKFEFDAITCSSEFTGNFSGNERSSEDCVSPVEAPTLVCPAEGLVNQCDAHSHYFCFGYCVPSDEGDICSDLSFNASDCEVVDCLNVRCPGTGIVNLEGLEDYGSFQYVTPVGTTETCS